MARKQEGPLPEGLRYVPEFLSPEEERELLARIARVAFREIRMRGQVALRRTAPGAPELRYSITFRTLRPAPPRAAEEPTRRRSR